MKKILLILLFPFLSKSQSPIPKDTAGYLQLISTNSPIRDPLSEPLICGKFGASDAGLSDGTQIGTMYQYRFTPLYNCTGIRILFNNWTLGNSVGGAALEALGANNITVTAYFFGRMYLTFNGSQNVTIVPGATVKSDKIPYSFLAGSNYFLRIYVSVATLGQKWPLFINTVAANNEGTIVGIDPGAGGLTVTTVTAHGYAPMAIVGTPIYPRIFKNVCVFGDSIFDGNSGGGIDAGWIVRGLNAANIPWMRMTVGGDKMAQHNSNATSTALAFSNIGGADIVIVDYGANDIPNFADLPTAKAAYLNFWNSIASTGAKVWQTTILPRTSFTTPQETLREGLNDWIRTKPFPLDNYIEVADLAETGRNTGVWKTGYSTDGVHPNSTTGEPALQVAIIAPMFKK